MLDWKDQYVLAIGLAWDLSDRVVLRAGYNDGKNPIPSSTVNPLLPASHEQTLTCGAGYALRGGWKIDAALEYMLDKKVTYDNPSSPLGNGATEEWHVIGLIVMVRADQVGPPPKSCNVRCVKFLFTSPKEHG